MQHIQQGYTVALFGNQPRTTAHKSACTHGYSITNQLGAQPTRTYRVIAPSNESGKGFGTIAVPDDEESIVFAEGILLTETNSGAFIEHADCPVVTIFNSSTRHLIVFHAGRPAQVPTDKQNIVTTALKLIARKDELDALSVYISGSICGHHFKNEDGTAKQHATQILNEFGPEVFYDLDTLSFHPGQLVRHQLLTAGLVTDQIGYDNLCTYTHPKLTSHRQHLIEHTERSTTNITTVVKL